MNLFKRIFALAGVVLLVGLYLVALILGLTASPASKGVLMAALGCTVVLPCLMYGMMLIARLGDRHTDLPRQDSASKSNSVKPPAISKSDEEIH